jgi:hypothetical protein
MAAMNRVIYALDDFGRDGLRAIAFFGGRDLQPANSRIKLAVEFSM